MPGRRLAGRLPFGWRPEPTLMKCTIASKAAAASALWAAAEPGAGIAAVVSRGGRPDLARPRLAAVTAPTLLIIGGRDKVVLDTSTARPRPSCVARMSCPWCPAPPHLFEEPGTLEAVAGLARDWFLDHLPAALP